MATGKAVAFTVDELCKLMASAKDAGVSEFQGGGISIKLVNDPFIRASVQQEKTSTLKQHKDLDQLLIENPYQWEEAMRESD